ILSPWGQGVGSQGSKGLNELFVPISEPRDKSTKFEKRILLSRETVTNLPSGTRIRISTPGGGGWSSN
ncbi:MAG: hypothetical protein ACC656_00385, partial [Candidatus Heimdallarchaeota archaeon]